MCHHTLDPETFYNNSLSTIATAAFAKIQLYYKNMLIRKSRKLSLKMVQSYFAMITYRIYEQFTPVCYHVSAKP